MGHYLRDFQLSNLNISASHGLRSPLGCWLNFLLLATWVKNDLSWSFNSEHNSLKNEKLIEQSKNFEIGKVETWLEHSDHMPIFYEFEFTKNWALNTPTI